MLFLAIFSASLGSCGACGGAYGLSDKGYIATTPDVAPDVADAQQQIAQILTSNPHRKALSVGRIVASILLLFSSLMLLRRDHNAIWWSRNAAAAGGVWVALHTWSSFQHRLAHEHELAPLAELLPKSEQLAPSNLLVYGAIQLAVYVYLFWRLGQPEIREEIERQSA